MLVPRTTIVGSSETHGHRVRTADLQKFRGTQRHEAEEHRTQRDRSYQRLPSPRYACDQPQWLDRVTQRPQEDEEYVTTREQPTCQNDQCHHHWPSATAPVNSIAFATNPPLGGRPIRDKPPSPKAKTVIGRARPIPESPAIRSCPSASAINPAAMNIAALAKACETA